MTKKCFSLQHSSTDSSGDVSMTTPDRPTATSQPISTEHPRNQDAKPKKKRKKKAKEADIEEEEVVKKAGGKDDKPKVHGPGSDEGEQVIGTKIIESSSPTVEEKKKRKKKPKEKAEGKEPKEPKNPKTPRTPKPPKEPKEKKTKSSTPKTKTPKKNR